jgi:cytochrome c oxidase cbb3-type subunit 1
MAAIPQTKTMTEGEIGLSLTFGLTFLLCLIGAAKAQDVAFGFHAYLSAAASLAALVAILNRYMERPAAPAPQEINGKPNYNLGPIKFGAIAAMAWGIAGFLVGCIIAFQLWAPDLNLGEYLSFGRLRPLHTSAVIFAFGGNVLIATSLYVVQRTCRARLAGDLLPWFVVLGYNFFIVIAGTGYLLGVTEAREYAEPEWYADLWLTIVWVAYLLLFLGTIWKRKEPHIFVANWFYLAFIVTIAMLHIVNNLSVPVSVFGSKSVALFSGTQEALVQWWYGHNAVAFFLTAGFLGMLYYYLPKRAERPIFSYRLSILSFWGITFFYMWAGSHHLHYTALPHWVQNLGMTFSVMLLVPSWASAGNALLTLNGAWQKVRDDATLRFIFVAVVFYGLSTFEGSFLAIRPVNALSHYTDWTVGHVHAGALGWVALITFGSIYTLVPSLWKRERMYSSTLVEVHFWLAVAGTIIYVFAMWNSGIIQGLMWRTYTEGGTLAYSFRDSLVAMYPYYIARTFGGFLFLLGAIVAAFNIWMTVRSAPAGITERHADVPETGLVPGAAATPAE